jgi:hypothetical protein
MKTQKVLVGTLVAAVLFFFLGWLIYGVIVGDFMSANCDSSTARPMEDFVWWSMILSNLSQGLLLCLLIDWTGSYSASAGAKLGAVTGLLAALTVDFSFYAMTTMYSNVTVIIVDAICMAVLQAIVGAIAAVVMNKVGGTKVAA